MKLTQATPISWEVVFPGTFFMGERISRKWVFPGRGRIWARGETGLYGAIDFELHIPFKTTFMCPRSIAGVPLSQALPGFLSTAPPSDLVPTVIGALAVWIQHQKTKNCHVTIPPYWLIKQSKTHVRGSIAGVSFDSAGCFRASILPRTTCVCSWCNKRDSESGEGCSLKLETQDCTTNPEMPPWARKPEFPISYKLRFAGLFLQKETYTRIPRADPFKSLDKFLWTGFRFQVWGLSFLVWGVWVWLLRLSIRMIYHQQNCTEKLVMKRTYLQYW